METERGREWAGTPSPHLHGHEPPPPCPLQVRECDAAVWSLSCSPDCSLLASGTDEGGLDVWDMRTGGRAWGTQVCACVWSEGGREGGDGVGM